MGLIALIFNIITIFSWLPKILDTIHLIIEIIEFLKPAEKALAEDELHKILTKYHHVPRRNRALAKIQGDALQSELDAMLDRLQEKVVSIAG